MENTTIEDIVTTLKKLEKEQPDLEFSATIFGDGSATINVDDGETGDYVVKILSSLSDMENYFKINS